MFDGIEVLPALTTVETSGENDARPMEAWARIAAFIAIKTENTRRNYLCLLGEWCRFMGAEVGTPHGARILLGVTELDAQRYRIWIATRPGQRPRGETISPAPSGNLEVSTWRTTIPDREDTSRAAPATIVWKLSVLRRFYSVLLGAGLTPKNPFVSTEITVPSRHEGQKRPTQMVPFELVRPSIESAEGPDEVRDRAVLALLYYCGIRRSELTRLRMRDVGDRKGVSFLRLRFTKGKRDAEQPIPVPALAYFGPHLAERRDRGAAPGDPLFVSREGGPLSFDRVYKIFRRATEAVGIFDATPHSARATAITKLLDMGIPYREVQEFSRHASVAMVEAYDKRRIGLEKNPGRKLDY